MRQTDPNLLMAATTNRDLLGSAADLSNEPAWKSLWDQYQKPILRLCGQSGLTEAEAQDVVQDAFLRVARMLESRRLEPMQNGFRRWLGHVVHRLIFEAHRRNRRHQLGVESVKRLKIWLPAVEAPADDGRAREHMEGHLWSVCLARVRSVTRPEHWQVFEAYALEGCRAAEVASRFGITKIGVRVIQHRIVRRLKAQWNTLLVQDLSEPFS